MTSSVGLKACPHGKGSPNAARRGFCCLSGPYLIELEFDDGRRGTVDFARYLERRGFVRAIPGSRVLWELHRQQGAWGLDVWRRDRHCTGNPVCGSQGDGSSGLDEPGWTAGPVQTIGSGCGNNTVERLKQALAVSAPLPRLASINPFQQIACMSALVVTPFGRGSRCSVQPTHQTRFLYDLKVRGSG